MRTLRMTESLGPIVSMLLVCTSCNAVDNNKPILQQQAQNQEFQPDTSYTLGYQSESCKDSNTVRIKRPYYPDLKSDSTLTFDYAFHVDRGTDENAPMVIFIPGGPGDTSIDSTWIRKLRTEIPAEFTIVTTDPRGVGCNAKADSPFPENFYNTQYVASDIQAIVKELKPKTYMLYGASYGTVVATIAGATTDAAEIDKPAAIVLDGTLGRAFSNNEGSDEYINQWNRIKSKLPQQVLSSLSNPDPFGFEHAANPELNDKTLALMASGNWGAYVVNMLAHGYVLPSTENGLEELLIKASSGDKDALVNLELQVSIAGLIYEVGRTKPDKVFYNNILCREIAGKNFNFSLQSGDLNVWSVATCENNSPKAPFDSAAWQLRSPVYYFQGELDPATPLFQAKYHFDHQKTKRSFVMVPGVAHGALTLNLSDCAPAIWKSISMEGTDLAATLKTCTLSSTLSTQE